MMFFFSDKVQSYTLKNRTHFYCNKYTNIKLNLNDTILCIKQIKIPITKIHSHIGTLNTMFTFYNNYIIILYGKSTFLIYNFNKIANPIVHFYQHKFVQYQISCRV